MQRLLVERLGESGTPHRVSPLGRVIYRAGDARPVTDAACLVRDRRFPWYLRAFVRDESSREFRNALDALRLEYFVEHNESRTWFGLPRAERSEHDEIARAVMPVGAGDRAIRPRAVPPGPS